MVKEDSDAIIRKLMRTEAYLDFLLALDENDLRTLIAASGSGWTGRKRTE